MFGKSKASASNHRVETRFLLLNPGIEWEDFQKLDSFNALCVSASQQQPAGMFPFVDAVHSASSTCHLKERLVLENADSQACTHGMHVCV